MRLLAPFSPYFPARSARRQPVRGGPARTEKASTVSRSPYPSRVTQDVLLVLLTGGFTLSAVFVTTRMSNAAERDRREAEDARRWHDDRRTLYARYLSLVDGMLIDFGVLDILTPSRWNPPINDWEAEVIERGRAKFMDGWTNQVRPALGEIQLLASSDVVDLAARVSSALFNLYEIFEGPDRRKFSWTLKRTRDFLEALCDAMRHELGVSGALKPRGGKNWPFPGVQKIGGGD